MPLPEKLVHRLGICTPATDRASTLIAGLALLVLTIGIAHAQTQPATAPQLPIQPRTVRIRILNAKTNQPITDERLNVALAATQIGSVAMGTDRNGMILVRTGSATTVRILSNMYADCRPRAELFTDYPIATINTTGITAGNLCSAANPAPRPGELLLFEIPRTFIPGAGQAPNTNLPHSDEYPR